MERAQPTDPLWPLVRAALRLTLVLNLGGAVLFAPPAAMLRALFGLPEAPPLYLWLISGWVASFGLAYFRMSRLGPDRTFMRVGAFGKALFGALVVGGAAVRALPLQASLVGLPDLFLAALFSTWLWRTREREAAPRAASPG